jgi:hypothetical protein
MRRKRAYQGTACCCNEGINKRVGARSNADGAQFKASGMWRRETPGRKNQTRGKSNVRTTSRLYQFLTRRLASMLLHSLTGANTFYLLDSKIGMAEI